MLRYENKYSCLGITVNSYWDRHKLNLKIHYILLCSNLFWYFFSDTFCRGIRKLKNDWVILFLKINWSRYLWSHWEVSLFRFNSLITNIWGIFLPCFVNRVMIKIKDFICLKGKLYVLDIKLKYPKLFWICTHMNF